MSELNIIYKFNKKTINIPSFINFIIQKANKNTIKYLPFYIDFEAEIKHIFKDFYWYITSEIKKDKTIYTYYLFSFVGPYSEYRGSCKGFDFV